MLREAEMKGLGIAKLARPKDPSRVFVDEYANPHAWLQTADRLHEQAVHMYRRRSSSPHFDAGGCK